jgi:hypothetical protein
MATIHEQPMMSRTRNVWLLRLDGIGSTDLARGHYLMRSGAGWGPEYGPTTDPTKALRFDSKTEATKFISRNLSDSGYDVVEIVDAYFTVSVGMRAVDR